MSRSCPNLPLFINVRTSKGGSEVPENSTVEDKSKKERLCIYFDFIFLIFHIFLGEKRLQSAGSDLRYRVQAQLRRVVPNRFSNQQELSLGLTLVTISVLFIVCQSVKLVPDMYELFCSTKGIIRQSSSGHVTCHSTKFIDTLIR